MTKWIMICSAAVLGSVACAKAQTSVPLQGSSSIAQPSPQIPMTENLRVTALSNQYRGGQGLGALRLDAGLSQVALEFAQDMMNRNYFDHVTPDGGTMSERLENGHIVFRAAGENIAKGQRDADAVMTAWMNSPGHRRNIMNGNYGKIGLAHVGPYWVMELTD